MNDIINPVLNTSYTNKDFTSIYIELLDLVKQLTYKWDPSISNESDPGVILLKLDAIIADKLNYNIDKNTLECFPASVTLRPNARQLFRQLGYYMSWYNAATSTVSAQWLGDKTTTNDALYIEPFTIVSDSDKSIPYTLLGPVSEDSELAIGKQKLPLDGSTIEFRTIQGIPVKYQVNNSSKITYSMLDSNRRLYFSTISVAQNGIYIENYEQGNFTDWKRVDNLYTEELGNTYYEFGVTDDETNCYIEFPEDAENLIGEGISITFINTLGKSGNIPAKILTGLFTNVYLVSDQGVTYTLDNNNFKVTNNSAITNGRSPETINEAYKNYKKTVGTFKTLVTLRDYMNYINKSGLVSNSFICDRTNDPQVCYNIMSANGGNNQLIAQIEQAPVEHITVDKTKVQINEPLMTCYNIKLYCLQYAANFAVNDANELRSNYNKTFEFMSDTEVINVQRYIEDIKNIAHDYQSLRAKTNTESHFCLFKNKYPINCSLTTQYTLSSEALAEVKLNIERALYQALNSSMVEFGDAADYAYITDIIRKADNRISNVILESIKYTTYAIYYDSTGFHEVAINGDEAKTFDMTVIYGDPKFDRSKTYKKSTVAKPTIVTHDNHRYLYTYGSNQAANTAWIPSRWQCIDYEITADEDIFTAAVANSYEKVIFKYGELTPAEAEFKRWSDFGTYGISYIDPIGKYLPGASVVPNDATLLSIGLSVSVLMRDEILTKSILAGVTPILVQDELFDFRFNQLYTDIVEDVSALKTNTDIKFGNISEGSESKYITKVRLRANEYLKFYCPSLLEMDSYSNYVKFEYNINALNTGVVISPDSDYELQAGDYMIFYWKEDNNEDSVYRYYVCGEGSIICPSFELTKPAYTEVSSTTTTIITRANENNSWKNIGSTAPMYVLGSGAGLGGEMLDTDQSSVISEIYNKSKILSGTKKISTKRLNQIKLSSEDYCYWILNTVTNGEYILFHDNSEFEYMLGAGEYFIYSNGALTDLTILGAGTTITRKLLKETSSSGKLAVPVTDTSEVLKSGVDALQGYWTTLPTDYSFIVTENQSITVKPNAYVEITPKDAISEEAWNINFSREGTQITPSTLTLGDFNIKYGLTSTPDQALNDKILGDITWNAKSLLAINMTPVSELVLMSGQSLSYMVEEVDDSGYVEEIWTTVTGYDADNNIYPTVFLSSLALYSDGSSTLPTVIRDLNGNETKLQLYIFKESLDNAFPDITYDLVNNSVNVFFEYIVSTKGERHTKEFRFNLPEGEYLIPINNTIDGLEELNIQLVKKVDGVDVVETLHRMQTSITEIHNKGKYFLYMKLDGTEDTLGYKLIINIKGFKESATLKIDNPFKYFKPANYSDVYFNKIMELLKKWDTQNLFNYTYIVPENKLISDPLAAVSFNKSNHIFNPYMICQIDTNNVGID